MPEQSPESNSQQFSWEDLPQEIGEKIGDFIEDPKTNLNAVLTSKRFQGFFGRSLLQKRLPALLSAVFMGNVEKAVKIIALYPETLFKRGTYKMPLLNEDGTASLSSEQIYYDVTPLELMFYTGDFKMWEQILPLIPDEMINDVLSVMKQIERGGPDLVNITLSWDEVMTSRSDGWHSAENGSELRRLLSWKKLQYIESSYGVSKRCVFKLLCNPDGIIFYKTHDNEFIYFYANKQTKVLEELRPNITNEGDQAAFTELQYSIASMIRNSSRRSSENEHALIQKVFGKKLQRNGIHYELNGIHYHDTYDGCHRLINAYRGASVKVLGLAQRYAMPNIIQRFFEPGKPFYPLPNFNTLKTRSLVRVNEFYNWKFDSDQEFDVFYPLKINSGIGFNYGLYKATASYGKMNENIGDRCAQADLEAICQIVDVTNSRFKELRLELRHKLPDYDKCLLQ